MRKNIYNIEQLLHNNYSLDDAMCFCGYGIDEKEMLEKHFKKFFIYQKYKKGNDLISNKKENIEINIL